jgi:sugar lactone lactonase YvrE
MRINLSRMMRGMLPLAALLLTACLSDNGGLNSQKDVNGGTVTTIGSGSYALGGAVSGLSGTVVLQNNGGDNLSVTANGNFAFTSSIASGSAYNVTVLTQPVGQTCSVSNGTGTMSGSNVNNVAVVCASAASTYSVGGTVSGLTGSVVLQNNSGDNLTVSANGAFTFATNVANGSAYHVTILTQPAGQNCSITNGTGTIAAVNIGNVAITCASGVYTIGGTVSGLNGSLVLQNNGADNLTISSNTTFTFPTTVATGGTYNVSVLSKPASQNCTVSAGSGTVATANISNVAVTCANAGNNHLMGGTMQGTPLTLTTAVSTYAGSISAAFNSTEGVVSDGANLYVADRNGRKIRKVVIATGVVSTLAGSGAVGAVDGIGTAATFGSPAGIAIDSSKTNLYVTDVLNHNIRKIVIASATVTTLAGSGAAGYADGNGTAAVFNVPRAIVIDSTNTNLYVTDATNNRIRKIVIAGAVVSTLAGSGTQSVTDGTGTLAAFSYPNGITIDSTDTNLYVTDYSGVTIRKVVIGTAAVTTLAGTANMAGTTDGTGAAARFSGPFSITNDGTNLYVIETGMTGMTGGKIRQIVMASGAVTTLAGSGALGVVNGTGTSAVFAMPYGLCVDAGNLYVSDSNEIRKVVIASGVVTTLAGNNGFGTFDGAGTGSVFANPSGITTDGTNLYVADMANQIIQKVVIASGARTVLAGSGLWASTDGTGTAASFNHPSGITTDGTNLYVTGGSTIRQIVISSGAVSTLAGSGTLGAADGTGAAASFMTPNGITTDGTNLYVADSQNNRIRKIVISSGVVTTLAGSGTAGSADGTGTAATFSTPYGITTDGTNLYVTEIGMFPASHRIRQIVISTGVVTTLAGSATAGSADGTGVAATFNAPQGISTDGTNLYVAEAGGNKIRKIVISTGVVTTLAGAGTSGYADGTGAAAIFGSPTGITSDGTSLYVVETKNNLIRKVQ